MPPSPSATAATMPSSQSVFGTIKTRSWFEERFPCRESEAARIIDDTLFLCPLRNNESHVVSLRSAASEFLNDGKQNLMHLFRSERPLPQEDLFDALFA